MDYRALPQAFVIKMMWTLLPLVIISISCIVNPAAAFLFSDPVVSVMIIIFPIPRIIRIIWDQRSELHLDDQVVRLTTLRGVREIRWCDAAVIQIKEKIRWYCEARVILVRAGEATIFYYISDLTLKDQKAIERQVERQPHYRHITL